MSKRTRFILIILLLIVEVGKSQKINKVVNQYVDYLNYCTYYVNATHYSVKDYNIRLLNNFNDPKYFNPREKIFQLKSQKEGNNDNMKLDLLQLKLANTTLRRDIYGLSEEVKMPLIIALKEVNGEMLQLIQWVNQLSKKEYTKEYFLEPSNFQNEKKLLASYENNVKSLDIAITAATKVSEQFFDEQLPKPLRRTKKTVLLVKQAIEAYKNKDFSEFEARVSQLVVNEKKKDHVDDILKMESFGDFNHKDNRQVQERANIHRLAKSFLGIKELLKKKIYKTPQDYHVRTDEKLENVKQLQYVYEVERLTTLYNENSDQSIVGNYNKYIRRADHAKLKVVATIIPYASILMNLPETTSEVSFEDITTLSGAKVNNLVLLLDVSTSMRQANKMNNLKAAINHLIDILRPGDRLTIYTYSKKSKLLFSSNGGNYDKLELKDMVNSLTPAGSTKIGNALEKAYKYCDKLYVPEGNNKIVIVTDGAFNVNKKVMKMIVESAKIKMSVFHVNVKKSEGGENNNLKKLAEIGGGKYADIYDKESAKRSIVIAAKVMAK